MAYEFKVGDRVRVVTVENAYYEDVLGQVGTIVSVDSEWTFPYEIDFDYGEEFNQDLFSGYQLELIESTEKKLLDTFFSVDIISRDKEFKAENILTKSIKMKKNHYHLDYASLLSINIMDSDPKVFKYLMNAILNRKDFDVSLKYKHIFEDNTEEYGDVIVTFNSYNLIDYSFNVNSDTRNLVSLVFSTHGSNNFSDYTIEF